MFFCYLCTLKPDTKYATKHIIKTTMYIDEEDKRSLDEILNDTEFPDDYDAFEDENLEMIP